MDIQARIAESLLIRSSSYLAVKSTLFWYSNGAVILAILRYFCKNLQVTFLTQVCHCSKVTEAAVCDAILIKCKNVVLSILGVHESLFHDIPPLCCQEQEAV